MELSEELEQALILALGNLNQSAQLWESPFFVALCAAFVAAAAAIAGAYIQRWQAYSMQERQSEIEKQLRVHSLQMEALKSLSTIQHAVKPYDEPTPGADSHEWLSPIVDSLSDVIGSLNSYLGDYGHVTPSLVLDHVRRAIALANEHKWGSLQADTYDYEPSAEEIDGVLELIGEMDRAVEHYKRTVGVAGRITANLERLPTSVSSPPPRRDCSASVHRERDRTCKLNRLSTTGCCGCSTAPPVDVRRGRRLSGKGIASLVGPCVNGFVAELHRGVWWPPGCHQLIDGRAYP